MTAIEDVRQLENIREPRFPGDGSHAGGLVKSRND
jgi:hypothetical protein